MDLPPPYPDESKDYTDYKSYTPIVCRLIYKQGITFLQYTQLHPTIKALCFRDKETYYLNKDISDDILMQLKLFEVVDSCDWLLRGIPHFRLNPPPDLSPYYKQCHEDKKYWPKQLDRESRLEITRIKKLAQNQIFQFLSLQPPPPSTCCCLM